MTAGLGMVDPLDALQAQVDARLQQFQAQPDMAAPPPAMPPATPPPAQAPPALPAAPPHPLDALESRVDQALLQQSNMLAATPRDQLAPPRTIATPGAPNAAADASNAAGSWLGGTWRAVRNAVTGEDRSEPGIGGLPSEVRGHMLPGQGMLGMRMTLAPTDQGKLDIFRQHYPDAPAREDQWGNVVVKLGDTEHYLNPPGFSTQGVDDAMTQGVLTQMVAGPLAKAGALFGFVPRVLGASAGGAVASLGQQQLAREAGSQQPVSGWEAAKNALGTGLGEAAAPAIGALARLIKPGRSVLDSAGGLTPEAAAILREAGHDPAQITPQMAQQFAKLAEEAANPQAAARKAAADTLPVPVRTTSGDLSQEPGQQMFERLTQKGMYGTAAGDVIRGVRSEQQDALRANIPAIQARISGGQPQVLEAGMGGAQAQEALVAQKAAAAAERKRLYAEAEASPAGVASYPARVGAFDVKNAVAAEHHLGDTLPRTTALLDDLERRAGTGRNSGVPMSELFQWRKQASMAARANAANEEGVALNKAVKAFDGWVDNAVTDGFLLGDQEALNKWRTAISFNKKEFAGKFQGNDLIQELTTPQYRSGQFTLKVAPEDAANQILGRAALGFGGKSNINRDVGRLFEVLGPTSAEANAIREEVFLRIAQAGEGAYQGSARDLSGVNMKKAWDNLNLRNPGLVRSLFDGDQRSLINQYVTVAADLTGNVKGGDQFSNTTVGLGNVVSNLAKTGFIGPRTVQTLMTMPLVRTGANAVQFGRAAGAAQGALAQRGVPPGLVGSFGGGAAGVLGDELTGQRNQRP